jgi:DNA primase
MDEIRKRRIITEVLGRPYKQGKEFLYPSRCCGHHKNKLSINFEKSVAKCWVCDWKVKSLRNIVFRWGNRKQKTEWVEIDSCIPQGELEDLFKEEEKQKQRIDLPEEFKTLSGKASILQRRARTYLKKRGVTPEDILKWRIGYIGSGDFSERIVFPSFNTEGYCNFFTARAYAKKWPNYLNGPGNKDIIFNDLFVDWTQPVTLVEGVFDAIIAGDNAIPILGSTLRKNSLLFQKIADKSVPVYLALDPDADKKSLQIAKSLLQYGIEVYKIDVSPYKDVGEMTKEQFQERKEAATLIDNTTLVLQTALSI